MAHAPAGLANLAHAGAGAPLRVQESKEPGPVQWLWSERLKNVLAQCSGGHCRGHALGERGRGH